jgi:hypothetical protein
VGREVGDGRRFTVTEWTASLPRISSSESAGTSATKPSMMPICRPTCPPTDFTACSAAPVAPERARTITDTISDAELNAIGTARASQTRSSPTATNRRWRGLIEVLARAAVGFTHNAS